ncbi:uncharacterized protein LOC134230800 [Saccostrea cucullata]|uniref:uncharacterized protein LOC134230800 n=1 Tax=Saccostrea cuccullata TaxID=36930 RepID=UPI002ED1C6E2
MKFSSIFIFLSCTRDVVSANAAGICSNDSIGEPLQCCQNYRQVGDVCEECWPGTYGWNCHPCPSGFYGKFCRESCNQCASCDPVKGCATSNNSTARITNNNTNQGTRWIAIAISVTGCFGVVFAALMCIYCIHIRKTTSQRCHENQAKPATGMQTMNMAYGLTRENDLVITLPNEIDSSNKFCGHVEDGPYDTLILKNSEAFLM